MKSILTVLIGSRAHNTNDENSDYDRRGIFVTPTSEILSIGGKKDQTSWIEGKTDDVMYEVKKFLEMSVKCNPSILEIYGAPVIKSTGLGIELRELFPHIWNKAGVFNAFRGYGCNQRKKFFEDKDTKADKYLAAWMRTLWQAIQLFNTGKIVVDFFGTSIYNDLLEIKSGHYKKADKLELIFSLERTLEQAYKDAPDKETDLEKVNKFLLKVRNEN